MALDTSFRAPGRRAPLALLTAGVVVLATAVWSAPAANAVDSPLPVQLATSSTYSVLAGTAVTNTLVSTLSGDLGISPGAALTGFPPGVTNGSTHLGDTPASLAQSDAQAAYTNAKNRTFTATISGDQAGQSFTSGVYAAAAALEVSSDGIVTLDAQDDPNAVFIFQVGSALNLGARTTVRLINSAQACNVFWQVGSSATVGASSSFVGTVLASAAVTVGADTTVEGRVLAGTAVTLSKNTFTTKSCSVAPPDGGVDADGAAAGADSVDGANAAGAGTGGVNGSDGGSGTGGTGGVNGSDGGAGTGGIDGVNASGSGAGTGASGTGASGTGLPDTGASEGLGRWAALGLLMIAVGAAFVVRSGHHRETGRHRMTTV